MLHGITHPKIVMALETRRAEREALSGRLQALLEREARVTAAWFYGSVGRGDEDDLSDLDVRVVVADEHMDAVRAQKREFVAQVGMPLLLQEAPQNAPAGGAFLLSCYDGQEGPQEIDWTWQPQSLAFIPAETRLILDRVGLPRSAPPHVPQIDAFPVEDTRSPERRYRDQTYNLTSFFWAMLSTQAKFVARAPWDGGMGFLEMLRNATQDARGLVDLPRCYVYGDPPSLARPEEKVGMLRELASGMEELMPQLVRRGGEVCSVAVPRVHRFLDLVESIACEAPEIALQESVREATRPV